MIRLDYTDNYNTYIHTYSIYCTVDIFPCCTGYTIACYVVNGTSSEEDVGYLQVQADLDPLTIAILYRPVVCCTVF